MAELGSPLIAATGTGRRIDPWGVLLALVVLLSAVPVFSIGIAELVEKWAMPAYTHGPVVVVMAAWIGLRVLRDEPEAVRRAPKGRIWPGIVLFVIGLLLGIAGTIGRIGDVAAYGIIFWVGGLLIVTLGWTRARRLALPVAMLVLMLPLPQFLYWKVTTTLQAIGTDFGAGLIRAIGLPVYVEGNIIDLGIYRLQVAEACAGLQYLFPIFSFAVLFAALSREPLWRRAALVIIAAPLAIAMNVLRISITAWLVDRRGIAAAEGFLHSFEGWAILLSALVILVAFMALLRLASGGSNGQALIDVDISGTGTVLSRAAEIRPSRRFVAVATLGVLAAICSLALASGSAPPPQRTNFDSFPMRIGAWQGVRGTVLPEVADVVKADDYLNVTYYTPDAEAPVQIFSTFYWDQTAGSAIHSPDICLPANGWEVSAFGTREVDMTDTGYGRFDAIRAVVTKGTSHQLVYYWFEQRGQRMVNDFAVKFGVLYDGVTRKRDDGALIRFVTPIEREGGIEAAEARIRDLMRQSLPILPEFVPF